jgi:hypothetical protein
VSTAITTTIPATSISADVPSAAGVSGRSAATAGGSGLAPITQSTTIFKGTGARRASGVASKLRSR